jgi:hydrogenase maturation protein HypF
VDRLLKMTQVKPDVVATDMHPSFLSSRLGRELAQKYNADVVTVQHHRAHVGSLVAEGVELDDVVGVAMDGVGYGEDGTVWGGEVFHGKARPAGLLPVPMPGGDLATRFPMRMVAGILYGSMNDRRLIEIMGANMRETEAEVILKQIERKVNVAYSSSAGRVLDAVAALLGVCYRRTYEGEPAMKLESFAFKGDASRVKLPCDVVTINGRNVVDSRSLLKAVVEALDEGKNKHDIAASAQASLARAFAVQACDVAKKDGAPIVGLSGGVAVNAAIGRTIEDYVKEEGLEFVTNHKLPCGDGGVSFGQAVLARHAIAE